MHIPHEKLTELDIALASDARALAAQRAFAIAACTPGDTTTEIVAGDVEAQPATVTAAIAGLTGSSPKP